MNNYKVQELTEIKKGQTGTGLLIENDGHIIGNSDVINQIKEDINNNHNFVCPDHFVVSAVFQKYGIKNANGRIYPENILKREVEKYIETRIANRCAIGALDHPNGSSLSGHDVAHNILDLRWQGRTLLGEMELHLSPGYKRYGVCSTSGDLVANMLLSNYSIGVSSRGVGSVKQMPGGIIMVDDDFELLCWDVVLEPSTPNAWIRKNASELEPFIETVEHKQNIVSEKIERIEKILQLK